MTPALWASTLGVPVLGAGLGAYIGNKYKHPVLGAAIGAAAGVTTLTAASLGAATSVLAPLGVSATAAGAVGAGTAGAMILSGVAVPCALGAGWYGLGRLSGACFGLRNPYGIGKNLAIAALSPIALPYGIGRWIINRFRK